jgi:ABC-type oligopeptide transport system substrate-binding subunit
LNRLEDSSLHTARAGWLLDSNNILVYFQKLIDQSHYEDAALTELVNTAQSALDSDEVDEYTGTLVLIHDHLIEHMVVIPLYYYER